MDYIKEALQRTINKQNDGKTTYLTHTSAIQTYRFFYYLNKSVYKALFAGKCHRDYIMKTVIITILSLDFDVNRLNGHLSKQRDINAQLTKLNEEDERKRKKMEMELKDSIDEVHYNEDKVRELKYEAQKLRMIIQDIQDIHKKVSYMEEHVSTYRDESSPSKNGKKRQRSVPEDATDNTDVEESSSSKKCQKSVGLIDLTNNQFNEDGNTTLDFLDRQSVATRPQDESTEVANRQDTNDQSVSVASSKELNKQDPPTSFAIKQPPVENEAGGTSGGESAAAQEAL
ncbi:MAG: hypothetical protein M1812_000038 [Candelaria pacifica]|nr:MAG: hypothetical protein M1812_000038 [Candelaria pacifica]